MASIQSLLNPEPPIDSQPDPRCQDASPPPPSPPLAANSQGPKANGYRDRTSSSGVTSQQQPQPRTRKSRVPKDAPVFVRGSIRGELRYPPCEERDEKLSEEHRRFQLYPMGEIAEYPRHIPYSSDKKSFMHRTGRDYFEVFQYTFQIPGKDKGWTIMWDYNIGLVRITHLFKCNDYPKTTPAKVLNANPGLREISHSITGGALAAQGYWMPYEAAKALAATFCWRIRYALTPLFGTDFPDMCLSPQQSGFGRMLIDADVIEQAARNAQRYRMLELQNKANSGAALGREPTSRPSPTTSPSLSKLRGRGRPPSSSSTTKKASATNTPLCHRASLQRESSPSTDDDDSEASSRRISTTTGSPSRRGSSSFTPINGVPPLRSPRGNVDGRSDNHHDSSPSSPPPPGSRKRPLLPSPSKILASVSRGYNSRILSSKLRRSLQDNDNDAESEHGSSSDTENPCQSRHRRHRRTTKDNSSVSVTLSDMMTDSELSSSSSSSLSSSYSFSFTDEDEEEKEEDADDEKKEEARHSRQPRDASPSPSRSSSSSSPSRNTVVRRLTREVKAAQALLTLQLQGGGEAHSSSTKNSRDPMNSGGFPRLGRLRASGVIEEGEMRERKRLRRASA